MLLLIRTSCSRFIFCCGILISFANIEGASEAGFAFGGTFRHQFSQSAPPALSRCEIRPNSALRSVLSPLISSVPSSSSFSQTSNSLKPSRFSFVGSEWSDEEKFAQLVKRLGAKPTELLRLEVSEDGMRGVYLNRDVKRGENLLTLPLKSCLCDHVPPSWMTADGNDESQFSINSYENPSSWATRLGASLLDLQLRKESASIGQNLWLSLLPNKDLLRASLPVHWDSDTLQAAHCTALELAVDSAYFARAQAVSEILSGLQNSELVVQNSLSSDDLEQLCHDALDVVQTRSCRLEAVNSDPHSPTLRVLAPIFDFINHGASSRGSTSCANACFGLQNGESSVDVTPSGFLVVSALRDIGENEEILIDYGSSARPAWKCLASYGFVPSYRRTHHDTLGSPSDESSEEEEEDTEDENLAEVYIDGVRYEVGPSTIPYDMVEATEAVIRAETFAPNTSLASLRETDQVEAFDETRLTPAIAIRIANRISDVAYKLLLQPEVMSEEEDDENDSSSPEQLVSAKLAASLRWSQHNILLACAWGLQDWAVKA